MVSSDLAFILFQVSCLPGSQSVFGLFPFIFRTASDPVLITIMSQSCIIRPDLSHIFWVDFQSSLGFTWYILIISANPSTFRKLHFFVFSQLYLSHIISGVHMGTAILSMQNDWAEFRRQINCYKNWKCMWSIKYNNLSLQIEFFPDIVRNTSSDVRGKLSSTIYSYWRNQIAYRLRHRDLLSPHPFLDLLSLWCHTALSARAKIKGCAEELVY